MLVVVVGELKSALLVLVDLVAVVLVEDGALVAVRFKQLRELKELVVAVEVVILLGTVHLVVLEL
jgi:hypothetical protein